MGWYNNDWNYRQKIIIDPTKVRHEEALDQNASSGNDYATLAGNTANFYKFRAGESVIISDDQLGNSETKTIDSISTGTHTTIYFTTNLDNSYLVASNAKITGNDSLSNFPTKITEINLDSTIFSQAQANGDDILFTQSDGETKLSHEIVKFDTSGQKVTCYVKVPSISPSSNTEIYIYYGNPLASNQEDITDVWSNSFQRVYHLNDDVDNWDSNIGTDDSFTGDDGDAPNTDRWSRTDSDSQINGNKLRIQPSTDDYDYVRSKFLLDGDFDIQVDFSDFLADTPSSNYNDAGLFIRAINDDNTGGQSAYIRIEENTDGNCYYTANTTEAGSSGASQTSITTDTSGKFRITRATTTITLYYWGGTSWTQLLQRDVTTFNQAIQVSFYARHYAGDSLTIKFDDFTKNSGTTCPPIKDSVTNDTGAYSVKTAIRAGKDGNGLDFNGTDRYIITDYYRNNSELIDVSNIIKWDDLSAGVRHSQGFYEDTYDAFYFGVDDGDRDFRIGEELDDSESHDQIIDTYYYLGLQKHDSGISKRAYYILNGITKERSGTITEGDGHYPFLIGARGSATDNGSVTDYIDGLIQEYRISNVARSIHWKYAEYNNILDPSNFYSTDTLEQLATLELEDIDNDFRMAKNWALSHILNDFRMKGITTVLSDIKNDFRITGVTLDDILNDFRMKGNIVRKDIDSDIRIVKQELKDLSNKISTTKGEVKDLNNDFRSCIEVIKNINNAFSMVKATISDINNDIRTKALSRNDIKNDFRMISAWQQPPAGAVGFQSAGKKEVKVYIDDVDQTDANIDSISITRILNGASTASFDLGRAYDDTKPSQKSVVTIKYKDLKLYEGYITDITPTDSPEAIKISCQDEYWELNKDKKYFFVGRKPEDSEDYYFETINDALTDLGLSTDIGNFVPQSMDEYGQGHSEAITDLVSNTGNFAWYIDPNGNKVLHKEGKGNIINLEAQSLGTNLGLYQVIRHSLSESIADIINKYRVQMGAKTIRKSTDSYNQDDAYGLGNNSNEHTWLSFYSGFAEPVWDSSLEDLANASVTGYGFDYQDPNEEYKDVFRKFKLPGLSSKRASWSNLIPPVIKTYTGSSYWGEDVHFTTEGFTIDYQGLVEYESIGGETSYYITPIITFSEPQCEYILNNDGEVTSLKRKQIRLYLTQEKRTTYNSPDNPAINPDDEPTEDTDNNPLMFYTEKMGTYPETIIGTLNLSNFSIQEGFTNVNPLTGEVTYVPSWDDTEFAKEYANWQLSKTCDIKTQGSIDVTIDAYLYYGIDLNKRIKINNVVDPINIKSITLNFSSFTATINVESCREYKRTENYEYKGE